MTTLVPVVVQMTRGQFVGRIEVKQNSKQIDTLNLCAFQTQKGAGLQFRR